MDSWRGCMAGERHVRAMGAAKSCTVASAIWGGMLPMGWGPVKPGREVCLSRTLMRPPVVKRQTSPRSGFLAFFRWVGPGAIGIQYRALTSFPHAGADSP